MTVLAAPPSTLRAYLDEAGDLPPDALLGRIVLFTITDEAISRSDLEMWFKELDLNTGLLPPEIKAVDAFKKATSEAKDTYEMSRGRTALVLCRDVLSNHNCVKRQITREVKDARARTLSYSKAIDCTFYRSVSGAGGERVSIAVDPQGLDAEERENVNVIAQAIKHRYQRYYQFLDGNKLRAIVRNYLKHMNAIELKGGVYFIHASRDEELSRLTELVERFGGGCQLHTIPIVDIERERQFIAQAFEREASQSLQDIAKEARELVKTRKRITASMYARIKERYDDVLAKASEHMMTLQVSQDVTGAAAEVALNSLTALQEEMLKE